MTMIVVIILTMLMKRQRTLRAEPEQLAIGGC